MLQILARHFRSPFSHYSFKDNSAGSDAQHGLRIPRSETVGTGRDSGAHLGDPLHVQMGRWVPEGRAHEIRALCHFKYFCKD